MLAVGFLTKFICWLQICARISKEPNGCKVRCGEKDEPAGDRRSHAPHAVVGRFKTLLRRSHRYPTGTSPYHSSTCLKGLLVWPRVPWSNCLGRSGAFFGDRRSSGSGRRADATRSMFSVAYSGSCFLKFKLLAKMAAVSHFKRTSVTFHPSLIVILDLIGIDGSLAKMARCKPFSVTSPVAALCCLPPLLAALGYVFFMTGT